LGVRRNIWPVENQFHQSPEVLFWNRWKRKIRGEPADQVHLEKRPLMSENVKGAVPLASWSGGG